MSFPGRTFKCIYNARGFVFPVFAELRNELLKDSHGKGEEEVPTREIVNMYATFLFYVRSEKKAYVKEHVISSPLSFPCSVSCSTPSRKRWLRTPLSAAGAAVFLIS